MRKEDKLLIFLARTQPDQNEIDEAERLAASGLDWMYLYKNAWREGVFCLVFHHLKKMGNKIPEKIAEAWNNLYRATYLRNEEIAAEAHRIIKTFDRYCVKTIMLKGVHLAENVYKNIAFRQMTDIDMLVKKEDFAKADEALLSTGYIQPGNFKDFINNASSVNAIFYRSPDGNFCVHLHRHLVNSTWPLDRLVDKMDMERIWSASRSFRSTEYTDILALSPEHLLIYLCLHGFGHPFNRLIYSTDILETLRRYKDDLDWDLVVREAEEFGLSSVLRYSFAFVSTTLGFEMPRLAISKTRLSERALYSLIRNGAHGYGVSYTAFLMGEDGLYRKLRFLVRTIFPSRYIIGHNIGLPQDMVKASHYLGRISR